MCAKWVDSVMLPAHMLWKSSHSPVFCAHGPVFVVITQNLFRGGLTAMWVIPVIYSKVLERRGKDEK